MKRTLFLPLTLTLGLMLACNDNNTDDNGPTKQTADSQKEGDHTSSDRDNTDKDNTDSDNTDDDNTDDDNTDEDNTDSDNTDNDTAIKEGAACEESGTYACDDDGKNLLFCFSIGNYSNSLWTTWEECEKGCQNKACIGKASPEPADCDPETYLGDCMTDGQIKYCDPETKKEAHDFCTDDFACKIRADEKSADCVAPCTTAGTEKSCGYDTFYFSWGTSEMAAVLSYTCTTATDGNLYKFFDGSEACYGTCSGDGICGEYED